MSVRSSDLQAIFDRIEAGKRLSQADLRSLVDAVRSKKVTLATGEQSVAIGGSADGAVIITGDRNVIIHEAEREAIYELLGTRSPSEKLLLRSVKGLITERLKQSLLNAVLIHIDIEARPKEVRRPWDSDIKIGDKPIQPIPAGWGIVQVFDEAQGKILIMGEPGAGKTTIMLELAQALCARAEVETEFPIPVLFNLSTWKHSQKSIRDWLITEMKSKYKISKHDARNWITKKQILPMLDGLDELESALQEPCIASINAFLGSEYCSQYLVVCSRNEEYRIHNKKLNLYGAFYIKSLSDIEIKRYLLQLRCNGIWEILENDWVLLNLVRKPFWLNIFILAFQEIEISTWRVKNTEEQFCDLLDSYIRWALRREHPDHIYKYKIPNSHQTRYWLSRLAKYMVEDSETEFLIEEMQINWLPNYFHNFIYKFLSKLLIGFSISFFMILLFYLLPGFPFNLVVSMLGLILGFLIGFSVNLEESIKSTESLTWSWDKCGKGIIKGINKCLVLAENSAKTKNRFYSFFNNPTTDRLDVFRIRALLSERNVWAYICLILGFSAGVVTGIIQGFINGLADGSSLKIKVRPNQGMWDSAKNFMIIQLLWMFIFGLTASILGKLILGSNDGLKLGINGIIVGVLIGAIIGLNRGGKACIQHLSLRTILYLKGYIPWNYARFLDYCTERLLVQRVGGRYRFYHRLLQEYFAAMLLENREDE